MYKAQGGEAGECPEGMVWSEEERSCIPIVTPAESKPLNAAFSLGENNKFTANYSGAVGPSGIQSNNVGVGYQNGSTNVNANYDNNNKSIMLNAGKTWNVGNGQLGVNAGYSAPTQGMNNGNFNGNLYYNTQLGSGDRAVPVKVNFGFGQQAHGGNVDPAALENAIHLINRAFGGMIPQALDGNMGAAGQQGNVEASEGSKFNINWNAASDTILGGANKLSNFMDDVNAYNPERDVARMSALNRPREEYSTMQRGLYGPQGDMLSNNIGNNVLNPTDVGRNNQRTVYAFGGRLYEVGGDVELDDSELEALSAAGIKFRRV
jgi:hypothetical protein